MYKELFEQTKKNRELSYSPYSKFKVGATVVLKNGLKFPGANIENSSYGLCMCAERNALYNAYLNGYKKDDIEMIFVLADSDRPVSPCGACRQVMSELMNPDCKVILSNMNMDIKETTVSELLPYSFEMDDMKNAK